MKNLMKGLLAAFALNLAITSAIAFPDVSDSHWAAPQIKLLSEQGVIVGYPDGTFRPQGNILRDEAQSVISHITKLLNFEYTLSSAINVSKESFLYSITYFLKFQLHLRVEFCHFFNRFSITFIISITFFFVMYFLISISFSSNFALLKGS